MSFYDIFAVIFSISVLLLGWLTIVFFCCGIFERKKDHYSDKSKKGGIRL